MMRSEDRSAHRYSSPPQQPSSFFACLNCYRDQQQLEDLEFSTSTSRRDISRVTSRRDISKVTTHTGPSDSTRPPHIVDPRLTQPRLSIALSSNSIQDKISVSKLRNRASIHHRHSTMAVASSNRPQLPDFLPSQNSSPAGGMNQRLSTFPALQKESVNAQRQSVTSNSSLRPSLTFTYQQGQNRRILQEVPQIREMQMPLVQTVPAHVVVPSQKRQFGPPQVVSQPEGVGLFSKESQEYPPFIPPLSKKSSSSGSQQKHGSLVRKLSNFGNGKVNLKIRQAVSIGGSGDESDHQSFVLQESQSSWLMRLNPIEESAQWQNQGDESPSMKRGFGWSTALAQPQV